MQGCTEAMGNPVEHGNSFWDRNLQFKDLDFHDFEDEREYCEWSTIDSGECVPCSQAEHNAGGQRDLYE